MSESDNPVLQAVLDNIATGKSRWVPVWTGPIPEANKPYDSVGNEEVRAEDLPVGVKVVVVGDQTPLARVDDKWKVISIPWKSPEWHDKVIAWIRAGISS